VRYVRLSEIDPDMDSHETFLEESHAIVIGAGIAGLLAARVLTDHFERVTVVDRDELPDQPIYRKGVPQARHIHLILVAGSRIVENLFPGMDRELKESGVPVMDFGWDVMMYMPQGLAPRRRSGLEVLSCSRALREATIRRRVAAHPRIHVMEGHEITGLVGQGYGVSGVRLRARGQPSQGKSPDGDVLRADLVVDAGGRESHNMQWLAALGFPAVDESVVSGFLGYASRVVRLAPGRTLEWKLVVDIPSPPDCPRGAGILAMEDNTWLVTAIGAARHSPPTDDAAFLEWTRGLRTPLIYDTLKAAEPLSPIHGYQRTANRFRHFERMSRWPERFVVVGDAAACFNPVYGQGMTVAAQSAVELDRCLTEHRGRLPGRSLTGFSRRFQKRLAKQVLTGPWTLATGEDFRWDATEGQRPGPLLRFMQKYADQVIRLALEDDDTHQLFLEVQHGIRPAEALLRPVTLGKVVKRLLHF
jgi:2-polyprenyl-6-methoxyphenol hydroxylase-like FAD-dependent oxidoreductase